MKKTEKNETNVGTPVPAEEVKAVIAKLNATLPMQFAVKCVCCGDAKKVRKDVFVTRVEKLQGDSKCLMQHYRCGKCRKAHNVDLIGRPKVAGGSAKILTLEDLI